MVNEASSRKRFIIDFDDTLAKVNAKIFVKNKGKESVLTPAEFAIYSPKSGDVFNFREFNSIIKTAAPIKTNIDLLIKAASDPATKTTILTARLMGYPVKRYLKKNFNLDVYIVALGDANPQKKSRLYRERNQKRIQ